MARTPLTREQLDDTKRLLDLWLARKSDIGVTQANVAKNVGFTNAAISGYLNGKWPLNPKVAAAFARELFCSVGDFSPSIQKEIDDIAAFSSSNSAGTIAILQSKDENQDWPFITIKIGEVKRLNPGQRMRLEGLMKGLLLDFQKHA